MKLSMHTHTHTNGGEIEDACRSVSQAGSQTGYQNGSTLKTLSECRLMKVTSGEPLKSALRADGQESAGGAACVGRLSAPLYNVFQAVSVHA